MAQIGKYLNVIFSPKGSAPILCFVSDSSQYKNVYKINIFIDSFIELRAQVL